MCKTKTVDNSYIKLYSIDKVYSSVDRKTTPI